MNILQSLHNLPPMNLASLSFWYVYLPVCLLVYYLLPKMLRPAVLLAASLGFYALSRPKWLLLICASVIADYILAQAIVMSRSPVLRKLFLWICVAKNIGLMVYFGVVSQDRQQLEPLGLFVAGVSGIYGALETYREENPQGKDLIRYAAYLLFFPRLYAGPLVSPAEFCCELGSAEFDLSKIAVGFGRAITGVIKYSFLGGGLFAIYSSIRTIPQNDISVLSSWCLVLSFALSLFFTLCGLADMARGIAGMFGLSLPQNFYYPYQSRSVTDFFDRFNMTLSAFLKKTVYEPLSPDGDDPVADSLNLLLIGMLWGIWFGLRFNHIVWGAFIGVFMIAEKYLYPMLLSHIPTLFCRGYALVAALLGLSVFAGDTLSQTAGYLGGMFGWGGTPLYNGRILFAVSSGWVLLAVAVVFATNIVSLILGVIRKRWPRASYVVFGTAVAALFAAFTVLSLGGAA